MVVPAGNVRTLTSHMSHLTCFVPWTFRNLPRSSSMQILVVVANIPSLQLHGCRIRAITHPSCHKKFRENVNVRLSHSHPSGYPRYNIPRSRKTTAIFPNKPLRRKFRNLCGKFFETIRSQPRWRGKLISEIDLIAEKISINWCRNRSNPFDFSAIWRFLVPSTWPLRAPFGRFLEAPGSISRDVCGPSPD